MAQTGLTPEERQAFFDSRTKFIEENSRKEFRETMTELREASGNVPDARKAFVAANPA